MDPVMDDGYIISTRTYILIELFLTFGGVLAFCFWQLWSLRKLRLEREAKERAATQRAQETAAS
jgi:hypothetical protein